MDKEYNVIHQLRSKVTELEEQNKKLEVENTMLIGEAEELKAKLAIAVEALDKVKLCSRTGEIQWRIAEKALTKIRSERWEMKT